MTRKEVPPVLLWEEKERCKPGTEGPVGEKEDGDLSSLFKNHLFYCIFGFFITLQLLRLAGALVRNHTLLIDSRVRIEASKWNESESFVFVSSRLCSFLYFCWGFYCSVLDKGFLWLFFRLARDVLGLVDVATEKLSERNGTKTHNFPLIFRATFALCYVKNSRYFFATFG